jgi:hypothetical protein
VAALLGLALLACGARGRDAEAVQAVVVRYNELLRDGYQRQNMSWMREVATEEQARKLYHHMAALGEGNLRLVSTLEDLRFVRVDVRPGGEASVETREVWDFTHYRIATGEKFAEERDFVYRMSYALRREQGRWIVTEVNVLSGEPGRTTIPWPTVDRSGNVLRGGPAAGGAAPR